MSYIQPIKNSNLKLRPQGQRYYHSITRHFFREEDLPRLRSLVPDLVPATISQPDQSGMSAEQILADRIRASQVGFIEPNADSSWLYQLIGAAVAHHNQTYYDYAIEGIETLQFSEYPASLGYYISRTWIGEQALYLDAMISAENYHLPYSCQNPTPMRVVI